MRAGRLLWAKLIKQFNPKSQVDGAAHPQPDLGWSLTEQDPFNNVARTCLEAMAAVLGHTQSLHTNALDEAIALPTDFSARIARNTQLYLQHETGICSRRPVGRLLPTSSADPRAGPARLGPHPGSGQAGRHGQGHRNRPAQDAHRGSGRPPPGAHRLRPGNDRRRQQVPADHEDPMDILEVDNTAVREQQVARLAGCAPGATPRPSTRSDALTQAAASGEGNLLELAVDAARARATLGEISGALEKVWGRHKAVIRSIAGVYAASSARGRHRRVRRMADEFAAVEGRRPRILVAKMGQDGHDRGRQGHRHRLRRPGLRRGHRPAVPDAGRGGPAGDGERRARGRRQLAGRRAQDAAAATDRRTGSWAATTSWSSSAASSPPRTTTTSTPTAPRPSSGRGR
jgi:methylmalonyl-CoA mutase